MSESPPFFVIAGPTASGKSELAVRLAEACGGEIVGADAFQVYEGLDILTAKPAPDLRRRVPHHLIGEVPLKERFDVAQFAAAAQQRMEEIRRRGAWPIVCGGTGLYVRALIRGLAALPSADPELRMRLEVLPSEELGRQLAERDPVAAAQIDMKNRRRVIRALEVCLLTGRPFSSFRTEWAGAVRARQGIILTWDRAELHRRIAERTRRMFEQGIEDEVRAVSQIGPTAAQAIGFREIQELIGGRMTRDACLQTIEQATRQYAKRQMTWFRRETALEALELSPSTNPDSLVAKLSARVAAWSIARR